MPPVPEMKYFSPELKSWQLEIPINFANKKEDNGTRFQTKGIGMLGKIFPDD